MERSNKIGWAQVRAGIFIFIALLCAGGGIALMGQKTKMFVPKGTMYVAMTNVAGLKEGAPVWLAGVDVGIVTDIRFRDPRNSNDVEIVLEVDEKARKKIGRDSLITIKTRGLMGEKYVDISPSASYSDQPETRLAGKSINQLDDVVQKAGNTFDRINAIVDDVQRGKGTLGKLAVDEALYNNVVRLALELKDLTTTINRGDGTLGRLNRNAEPYDKLMNILNRTEQTLQAIHTADGTLNRFIYDKTLYAKLVSLADKSIEAADDVRELNRKITSKESTIGMLIGDREFYDKGLSLLTRADASTRNFEQLVERISRGEGTAGKIVSGGELYDKMNKVVDDVNLLVNDIKKNPGRYLKFSLF